MTRKTAKDLIVDSSRIYSLDRCIDCLSEFNIGQNCYCTVVLKKGKNAESGFGHVPEETQE